MVCGGGTVSETFPPRDLLENLGNAEDNQLERAGKGLQNSIGWDIFWMADIVLVSGKREG
jgi:hypothetical protein